jgi:anti-anti-sigma factor
VNVTIEPTIDNGLRVRLSGELDTGSAPTLTTALAGLRPASRGPADRRRQIVLDISDLDFLDTGGLAALDDCRADLLAAGWFVTAGPAQPQVHRLLRYANRAGWLIDGPLSTEESSAPHLLVVPAPAERHPRSGFSPRRC